MHKFKQFLIFIAIIFAVMMFVLLGMTQLKAEPQSHKTQSEPIAEIQKNIRMQHEQMLYTTVLVAAKAGTGSGTVIFSKPVSKFVYCYDLNGMTEADEKAYNKCLKDTEPSETYTYVLTNFHVVSDSISVAEEWNPKRKKDVKTEKRVPVEVKFFDYNNYSREVGTRGKTADIVAYNKDLDLALVRIRDTENTPKYIATLKPAATKLYAFEPAWAVGAGLGKPPFPTSGMIANLDQRFNGHRYMLSTAPIIFGNSGGGLYHFSAQHSRYELIGVPSQVSAVGFGQAVSHMGWSIPMETIKDFLTNNNLSFVHN